MIKGQEDNDGNVWDLLERNLDGDVKSLIRSGLCQQGEVRKSSLLFWRWADLPMQALF